MKQQTWFALSTTIPQPSRLGFSNSVTALLLSYWNCRLHTLIYTLPFQGHIPHSVLRSLEPIVWIKGCNPQSAPTPPCCPPVQDNAVFHLTNTATFVVVCKVCAVRVLLSLDLDPFAPILSYLCYPPSYPWVVLSKRGQQDEKPSRMDQIRGQWRQTFRSWPQTVFVHHACPRKAKR
jgi:hypothetical protein